MCTAVKASDRCQAGSVKCTAEGLAPVPARSWGSAEGVQAGISAGTLHSHRRLDWLLVQFLGSSRNQWGWGLRKEHAWSQVVNVSEHQGPCGDICRELTAVLSAVFFQW